MPRDSLVVKRRVVSKTAVIPRGPEASPRRIINDATPEGPLMDVALLFIAVAAIVCPPSPRPPSFLAGAAVYDVSRVMPDFYEASAALAF